MFSIISVKCGKQQGYGAEPAVAFTESRAFSRRREWQLTHKQQGINGVICFPAGWSYCKAQKCPRQDEQV